VSQALDDETVFTPVLHHVNLGTRRLDEMIAWYGEVVGMEVHHRAPVGAWLSNDAANHRIALLAHDHLSDDPDKQTHTGLRHIAFEYGSIDELLGTYVRLRDRGIVPRFCLDHGLTLSFYYADPDGNRVELQVDCFGDWHESSRFMREAPAFAADPMGPDVDPEAMVAAWRDGGSLEELHRRAYAGGFPPADPLDPRLR
jgi:catechol-2,3-dioxygenase